MLFDVIYIICNDKKWGFMDSSTKNVVKIILRNTLNKSKYFCNQITFMRREENRFERRESERERKYLEETNLQSVIDSLEGIQLD